MDRHERFALLSSEATRDREHGLSTPSFGPRPLRPAEGPVGIRTLRMRGGGTTRLMRVMQTNACSLSCGYCPTFCGGTVRRVALSPEEVARTFMEAHRAGQADGLFLTSGVPGRPERAMGRMLAAVDVLRRREGFAGYVHLKALPGSDDEQIREATRLASRVSINLEGPTDAVVRALAKEKDLSGDLLPKLTLAGRLSREARLEGRPRVAAPSGTTTQFVVGSQGETDRELLALVSRLERAELLHHAHFSAFQPVAGTPMEGLPATPATREYRLYQAEYLLRQYGFEFDDLVFEAGNLALDRDPKTAWALAHPALFPVDVLRAPREMLLRVPGIGPRSAERLLGERRRTVIRGLPDLRRLGVDVARGAHFMSLGGRRLMPRPPAEQLRLFPHGQHLPAVVWKTPVPPCAYR
jgi:predicted DNA-binding helix-hairpin-helix protein